MHANSYEYACLIDQFWFEYELHVSSSRIQIFKSLLCSLLHAHLSRMHAPSCRYHSLFSSSPTRSLHVSPIFANMVFGVLGTGIPRLACLRPTAWLCMRAFVAHLHQQAFKTLARGQASQDGRHKTSSGAASPGWLARGGETKARQTS